jgi:hypothetical protein
MFSLSGHIQARRSGRSGVDERAGTIMNQSYGLEWNTAFLYLLPAKGQVGVCLLFLILILFHWLYDNGGFMDVHRQYNIRFIICNSAREEEQQFTP